MAVFLDDFYLVVARSRLGWRDLENPLRSNSDPRGRRHRVSFEAGVPGRIAELAERLVASGPKAAHVSASECHEISDFIRELAAAAKVSENEDVEPTCKNSLQLAFPDEYMQLKQAQADAGKLDVQEFAWMIWNHAKVTPQADRAAPMAEIMSRLEHKEAVSDAIEALDSLGDPAPSVVIRASALSRYGKPAEDSMYLLDPRHDGYWTPWHIAQEELDDHARIVAEQKARADALAGVLHDVISAAQARTDGYADREHGAVVNGRAAG